MLKQYIILFNLFGNDFLPKLLGIQIKSIWKLIEIYNMYLKNKYIDGLFTQFLLDGDINALNVTHFLADFSDETKVQLKKNVLHDILKLFIYHHQDDIKSVMIDRTLAQDHDKSEIGRLVEELMQTELTEQHAKKNLNNTINHFLNKSIMDGTYTNESVINYNFIKHLLNNNYYISIDDISDVILSGDEKKTFKDTSDKINKKLLKDNTEIKTFETQFFHKITLVIQNFLKYVIKSTENPPSTKIQYTHDGLYITVDVDGKYVLPFSEIIKYDIKKNSDDKSCVKNYLEGIQYISDLYFTMKLSNECWFYECDYAPSITSILSYLSDPTNNDASIFDYNKLDDLVLQKHLYDSIDHQLTMRINTNYLKNIRTFVYYLIDKIFDCYNETYTNKCPISADMSIIFLDKNGKFVNISRYCNDSNPSSNQKIHKILKLAYADFKPDPTGKKQEIKEHGDALIKLHKTETEKQKRSLIDAPNLTIDDKLTPSISASTTAPITTAPINASAREFVPSTSSTRTFISGAREFVPSGIPTILIKRGYIPQIVTPRYDGDGKVFYDNGDGNGIYYINLNNGVPYIVFIDMYGNSNNRQAMYGYKDRNYIVSQHMFYIDAHNQRHLYDLYGDIRHLYYIDDKDKKHFYDIDTNGYTRLYDLNDDGSKHYYYIDVNDKKRLYYIDENGFTHLYYIDNDERHNYYIDSNGKIHRYEINDTDNSVHLYKIDKFGKKQYYDDDYTLLTKGQKQAYDYAKNAADAAKARAVEAKARTNAEKARADAEKAIAAALDAEKKRKIAQAAQAAINAIAAQNKIDSLISKKPLETSVLAPLVSVKPFATTSASAAEFKSSGAASAQVITQVIAQEQKKVREEQKLKAEAYVQAVEDAKKQKDALIARLSKTEKIAYSRFDDGKIKTPQDIKEQEKYLTDTIAKKDKLANKQKPSGGGNININKYLKYLNKCMDFKKFNL
jgi:hypothetical protein